MTHATLAPNQFIITVEGATDAVLSKGATPAKFQIINPHAEGYDSVAFQLLRHTLDTLRNGGTERDKITFKAIPVKDRQPEQFYSIHFVLLDGRLPMMAQYNPQGWCYLQSIPAREAPKVIGGKGVSHWLERQ